MTTSYELPEVDLSHPDSCIRLASAVHRFKLPIINPDRKVSFAQAFRTTGTNSKTRKVMLKADEMRKKLKESISADKVSHERVVADAKRYQPLINQILLSCKVQPEMAMLDERLVFDWSSGLQIQTQQDKKKKILKTFQSEAMMYDLVMCLICEGIGKAGVATETSMAGEFAAANREYAAAAGIFDCLANDHLPKWKSRGAQVDDNDLPVECNIQVAKGLNMLFKANGQQMAVTTVLIKPGTPNYSLLAKLCLGVQEQLEGFIMHMRDNAFRQMSRIEKDFFTLIAFQTQLYKGLTYYFHAKSLWDTGEYGLAIAMLSDATVTVRTRTTEVSEGLPDVAKVQALLPLIRDLDDLRKHMAFLLKTWEKDNSECYFDVVPTSVPLEKKLEKGVQIGKSEAYRIKDPEPLLLSLPEDALKRSDSDLARELQEKFDAELKD